MTPTSSAAPATARHSISGCQWRAAASTPPSANAANWLRTTSALVAGMSGGRRGNVARGQPLVAVLAGEVGIGGVAAGGVHQVHGSLAVGVEVALRPGHEADDDRILTESTAADWFSAAARRFHPRNRKLTPPSHHQPVDLGRPGSVLRDVARRPRARAPRVRELDAR